MNEPTRLRVSQLFAALSHPTRLRIVELLCDQEMSVNQIHKALSLSQSATSQNLTMLARVGVLKVEAQGTSRIYRLRGPRIGRILALIEEFCQVHALYGLAEEIEADRLLEEKSANDKPGE